MLTLPRATSGALACVALLLSPAAAGAAPTLVSDERQILADAQPPFSTPPETEFPAAPFDPFVGSVMQGGTRQCMQQPGIPANASADATQNSTVSPVLYAGVGEANVVAEGGSCISAEAEGISSYRVSFTTDVDYDFDLSATLDNGDLLLEDSGGTPLASLTSHTGAFSTVLLTLPPDTYTIEVEVHLLAFATQQSIVFDSGSFDLTLELSESVGAKVPALTPVGLVVFSALIAGAAVRQLRTRR